MQPFSVFGNRPCWNKKVIMEKISKTLTRHQFLPILLNVTNNSSVSQPITRRQILDSSSLKKFADDNFRFEENGRKLTERVENTVGKGETAHYEKFLLFPQCFQKACLPGASKGVFVWEWINPLQETDELEQPFIKKDFFKHCERKR